MHHAHFIPDIFWNTPEHRARTRGPGDYRNIQSQLLYGIICNIQLKSMRGQEVNAMSTWICTITVSISNGRLNVNAELTSHKHELPVSFWSNRSQQTRTWNRSVSFRQTQWLKIISHMIRSYYRCFCINEPVILSHGVHLKLRHRFHALLNESLLWTILPLFSNIQLLIHVQGPISIA